MRYFYASRDVRAADARALEEYGLSGEMLMENAGGGAAREIMARFPEARRVGILCGPGNNGGDGFVAARHLQIQGRFPELLLAADPGKYRDAAKKNFEVACNLGIPWKNSADCSEEELRAFLENRELLVDGLLGTGTTGAPRGEIARLLELLARASPPLAALDMPSGIHPDSGALLGPPLRAACTCTFLAPKPGLLVLPGAECAGEVISLPIGIAPEKILPEPSGQCWRGGDTGEHLALRGRDMHKGNRSTVLILGGSSRYRGAPVLAALGALRAGAGVVVLGVPEDIASSCAALLPEAVIEPLKGETLSPENIKEALDRWEPRCTSILAGPGMGRSDEALESIAVLWKKSPLPLVVDADGLFALGEWGKALEPRKDALLTPHEGEAARLLGCTSEEIRSSRLESAKKLAEQWGTVLLKGATTVVHDGAFPRITASGSPALAVPGSGDVLGGIVASLLGEGLSPALAGACGAWLHGMGGSLLERTRGIDGVLASEIAEMLPEVLFGLRREEQGRKILLS